MTTPSDAPRDHSATQSLLTDIATRDAACLPSGDTVGEAARLMAERRISSIVVTDAAGHPSGVITERDMLYAMHSGLPRDTPLRALMSSPLITVPQSITLLDAYQLCLRNGVRHLMIVDDENRLAGVVSETDFRLHMNLTALAGHRSVVSAMQRSALALPPEAGLDEALEAMKAHRGNFVVVVQEQRPVGIVTERDIVRLYSRGTQPAALPLREIMTSPVLTAGMDDNINQAAKQMLEAGVRHLAVVDGQGRLAGLIGEHDLTQAMALGLMDEKLAAEGVFLRTLLDALPDMVWLKDADGFYLACNRRFESFLGVKEQDILGKTADDFLDPHLADSLRQQDLKAMAANSSAAYEKWLTFAADGYRGLFEIVKMPMRDGSGDMVGVLGIAHDVTRHWQLEQELKENEKRFHDIVENAPLGMVTLTPDGRFIQVNQTFCNMVGYPRETLQTLTFGEITHPDDVGMSQENIQKLAAGKIDSYRVEKRYFHRDGHVVWAQVDVSMQRDPSSGAPQYLICQIQDVTTQRQAEMALRTSEEKLRSLYELSPLGIALTDMQGRYIEFNDAFRRICGYDRDELNRLDYWMLTPHEYAEQETRQLESLKTRGYYGPYEKEYVRKDGSRVPLRLNGVLIRDSAGQSYIWSIVEDISAGKRTEETLRVTASVFETTQEAIVITDANNLISDVNPAFSRITGYSREEVLGKNPRLLSSGRHDRQFYAAMWRAIKRHHSWRGEIWNRRKSGEIYAELLSVSVVRDDAGRTLRHVGVFSDISHIKEHEAELSRAAHYDALTGVPNRMLLADRMKQALAQTARERNMMAVCYLDLDGFKPINDALGHKAGDQVLIEVARRIEDTIRGGDTVARLGGDEFVILLLGLERGEECASTLERVLAAIGRPIVIGEQTRMLSASIGVSLYPLDDEDPDTLLRHADQAMYVAKQSGKNRFYVYDPALDQRTRNRHALLEDIRRALRNRRFELYYQPKIALDTRRLVGAEALIRWHHPERGLLPPAEFLHLIENTELDIELGDWVIAEALDQLGRWRAAGLDIEVSVNVSAHHLESPRFTEKLRQQLARHPGLPPGRLQIELLETAMLEDTDIVRGIIESCRALGVRFALDDFGTGYSSLSYLSNLPVDVLKIDQTFVRGMLEDKGDLAIVHGILALARAFGREVVAEGIETDAHYRALLDAQCGMGQGYGIARPMRAEELPKWKAA